jgi:lipid-A-disaccharide synthase
MKIFMSAGEASGDLHGAQLISSLKSLCNCECAGMGGPAMVAAGLRQIKDISDMQVMGFVEVVKHIGHFRRVLRMMEAKLAEEKPDAVLLVDYPGFNLRLAKAAKRLGLKTVLYVAPQVWAWRSGRAKCLASVIDHLLVLFRFEVDFFKRFHPNVHFIGHPLMDEITVGGLDRQAHDLLKKLEISPDDLIVALLPGSRANEIKSLLPIYCRAMELLASEIKDAGKFTALIVRASASKNHPVWEELSSLYKNTGSVKWHLLDEPAPVVAKASKAAVVASGTATLETGIAGTPMIVCYTSDSLSVSIAKQLVDIPAVGLVNVISGKPVCPELIQDSLNPLSLSHYLKRLLFESAINNSIRNNLKKIPHLLGEPGSSARSSQIICEIAQL